MTISASSNNTINSEIKIGNVDTFKNDNYYLNENRKSIAVLIDCWDPNQTKDNFSIEERNTRLQTFYNIVKTVPEIPNLAAVILSTYDSNEYLSDLSYYNNTQHLFLSQEVNYIKENYYRTLSSYQFKGEKTYESILRNIWPCMSYGMTEAWQLEYLINRKIPKVQNIFFLGMHLNMCVTGRPIGVNALKVLKKYGHLNNDVNFFTIRHCVIEWDHEYKKSRFPTLKNSSHFEHIQDEIYRFI
jgi:hypothetical protein